MNSFSYHPMLKKLKILSIIVLPNLFSFSYATTATTSFTVNASVIPACVVTALPLEFGVYNPVGGTSLAVTTTITTTCTISTSYTTGLSAGSASGATVTSRSMTGVVTSSNSLPYGLYQDSAHTKNWGNTPGTDTPNAVTGTGLPQSATVYGLIPANTSANLDTYLDTINVTVTY